MSGIAGLLLGPQQVVEPGLLESMAHSLAHRGRDASATWRRGPIGLACQARWTTPEARGERQPLALDAEDLVVCADVRLDHREELLDGLGLGGPGAQRAGDAELVLRAYLRWGETCVTHLRGDFAFALWDGSRRRLFCARDAFGVRPFYYHRGPDLLAFASEIKGLLAVPDVPRQLDELHLAGYLAGDTSDQESTFWDGVRRLPAGHTLTIEGDQLRVERYFTLDPFRRLPRAGDRETEAEFLELFQRAVGSRLRSAVGVGAMLSGGMDSSAIACVARDLLVAQGRAPLSTFSMVFDGAPEADERRYAEAVVAGGGMAPHYLRGDLLSPLGDLDEVQRELDEPLLGGNLHLNRAMARLAHAQGVGALLDGFDGDTVVGYGLERLTELARRGRLLALGEEMLHLGRVLERPRWPLFRALVLSPLAHDLRGWVPERLRASRRTWKQRGASGDGDLLSGSVLDKEFAARVGFLEHVGAFQPRNTSPDRRWNAPQQFVTLTSGLFPASLEALDRLAAATAVEPRYPFFDQALVEFCLALPARQKLRRGWTRSILRRSIASLPEEVRWRGSKARLGPTFSRGLIGSERVLLDRIVLSESSPVRPYVDMAQLRLRHTRLLERQGPDDAFVLCKVAALGRWLETAAPLRA